MFELPLNLFVDITTRCNAGCPQCHRTDLNNVSKKVSWLPDINWDIDTFIKAYPIKVLDKVRDVDFCGTWGDPMANKDIIKMVNYIVKANNHTTISINTNGSLRNEKFWWELGKVGGNRLTVFFAVEGINQEMHEVYRQNTNLDKILNNMKTLALTRAKPVTQTLIWKHNQDYLNEIEDMCNEYGSMRHLYRVTDRWKNGVTELIFKNKGKTAILEKTGANLKNNKEMVVRNRREFVKGEDNYKRSKSFAFRNYEYIRKTEVLTRTEKEVISKLKEQKKKVDIVCEWGVKRKVVINPDGQVYPCCYFCNGAYETKFNKEHHHPKFLQHPVMIEYKKHEKEMNVFHNDLISIVKNDWFTKTLPNSWINEPVKVCEQMCGKI